MSRTALRDGLALFGLAFLAFAIWWFAVHAVTRGLGAVSGDAEAQGRFAGNGGIGPLGLYLHMIFGGIISLLALLQWAGPVRRRWPLVHRLSGRLVAGLAALTAVGGLTYIALEGTIGGPQMSAGFTLYGVLMLVAAVQAPRLAMAGEYTRHRRWAVRLIVLCLASWLYRVHYGVFYAIQCPDDAAACVPWSTPEFSGLFDLIQNWAFYLPYLILAEIWLRLTPNDPRKDR